MRRVILSSLILIILGLFLFATVLSDRRLDALVYPVSPSPQHGSLMANLDISGLDLMAIETQLQNMSEDGISIVRIRFPWAQIEPQPGQWQWQMSDVAVQVARDQDLEIVALLDGSPPWAVEAIDASNSAAPPHDVRDFGQFARQFASRYGAHINRFQIWDEPNIAPHWGERRVNPRGYFSLLREAANSIHSVQPEAEIILASLAPTTADDGANLSDIRYLEALYELGAAEWFDIVAAAAYGFEAPPQSPPHPGRLNFRRPELIYDVMTNHQDGQKSVWITSWGWWTPLHSGLPPESPWGSIPLAGLNDTQAAAQTIARDQWPWMGAMAWAEYQVNPHKDPLRAGFALRDEAGRRTQAAAGILPPPSPPPYLATGWHPIRAITLGGMHHDWRISPDAADPNQKDVSFEIDFTGRAIALEIQRGDYWAEIRTWVDKMPSPLPPKDSDGNAYIGMYDPSNGVAFVPLASNLEPGKHRLRLTISGGWGQWPIRAIVIDHDPWPSPPFRTQSLSYLQGLATVLAILFWLQAVVSSRGHDFYSQLQERLQSARTRIDGLHPLLPPGVLLVALAVFYFVPGLLSSGLLLVLIALWILLTPSSALLTVLVVLPFYLQPKSLGTIGISLHELTIWLAVAIFVFDLILAWLADIPARSGWHLDGFDVPALLLLLLAIVASFNASYKSFAFYELRTVFVVPFLYYWLLSRRQRPSIPHLADALVLGATLLCIPALWQLVSGAADFVEGVPRIRSLFGSANNLALYLGRTIPLLLAMAISGSGRRRWIYAACGLLVTAVAFLTFSRGLLFLSLPAGILVLAVFEPRLRRAAALFLVLILIALLPFAGTTRFRDVLNIGQGTTFFRLQLWQSAWRMFVDHPWLGVGPDNFLYAYRSTYVLPEAWAELNLSHPHNLFLDTLTRLGVAAFAVVVWLLGKTLWQGSRLLRIARSAWDHDGERVVYLGLFAGLVAGLFHGMIDNSLFLVDLAILTYLVIAVTRRYSLATSGRILSTTVPDTDLASS